MRTRPIGTSPRYRHRHIETACGRRISVGLLALGDAQRPARRISLAISPADGTGDGAWAGLTAREARDLATALLIQVATAERAATRDLRTIAGQRMTIIPSGVSLEEAGR